MAISKVIQRITNTAEELYKARQAISQYEEDAKKVLEPLKAMRDKLQEDLLTELNAQGLSSIKTKSGDSFAKAVRKGVAITSEAHALEWAIKQRCVRIDSVVAGQLLKDVKDLPPGFELRQSEYISVRKPSKVDK